MTPLLLQARRRRSVADLRESRFGKQREVIEAIEAGARRAGLRCARRSGKSWLGQSILVETCLRKEHARCLYLALTHDNVRRIAWDTIQRLDQRHSLGLRLNEAFLRAKFPQTDGLIEYCGLNAGRSLKDPNQFRGAAEGFDIVIVDEASQFDPRVLRYLLDEVIEPALMDKGGTLILTGTPTATLDGPFYNVTSGSGLPGWRQFHWTPEDNPHMREQWRAAVAEKRAQNPRIDEQAWFRREYFGEWAADASDLVYIVDDDLNLVDRAPEIATWAGLVLGVDLGYRDSTGFVVAGWCRGAPVLWVLESFKAARLLPEAIARHIRELQTRWPGALPVIDTGSGGAKTIAAELADRYGIQSVPADKTDKATHIGMFNSDLAAGRIKIVKPANAALIDEYRKLVWHEKRNGGREEDPSCANDLTDPALYAWRHAFHHMERPRDFARKTDEERLFDRFVLNRKRTNSIGGWR